MGGMGVEGTPAQSFWYVAVFRNDLPSVEGFQSSQQYKVYFMGGDAAGGLWRHLQWAPSWILSRIRNQEQVKILNVDKTSSKWL